MNCEREAWSMKNNVFMGIVDYERQKRAWTVRYLCDEYGVERKDYDYYAKGIKTPTPDFVFKMIRAFGLDSFM